MNWFTDEYQQVRATVPARGVGGATRKYEIYLTPRPSDCDRGDWLIHVEQEGHEAAVSIDHADGFPRYFFGDAEAGKAQMEEWVRRRRGCQR